MLQITPLLQGLTGTPGSKHVLGTQACTTRVSLTEAARDRGVLLAPGTSGVTGFYCTNLQWPITKG